MRSLVIVGLMGTSQDRGDYVRRIVDKARYRIIKRHLAEFEERNPDVDIPLGTLDVDQLEEMIEAFLPRDWKQVLGDDLRREEEQIRDHFEAFEDYDE